MDSTISAHAASAMAAVSLGLVLTPGPNMMYLVSRSITQGRRAGLVSLLGVALGFLIYLAAVTTGLSAVFTLVPGLYLTVKLAGAGYLLYLAWNAVRPGGTAVFAPVEMPADRPLKLFGMGLITCLLNPKIAVMYLSLLPQFVDPARGHVAEQSFLLGLTQIAVALCGNCAIALSAGSIAGFLADRPVWLRVQRYLMGTVLGGLALRIAFERSSTVS
jgi:threonine/homoserine/homoserine lactone efflux protein